jgi:hypothetical protein
MTIHSQNFKLLSNPGRVRTVWRPNYTGPELVRMAPSVPAIVQQSGLCDPSDFNTIISGKGDPNVITNTLNALNLGVFPNVWKEDAWIDPVGTTDHGKLFYTIVWKQLAG